MLNVTESSSFTAAPLRVPSSALFMVTILILPL
jgi:hypothetical protein